MTAVGAEPPAAVEVAPFARGVRVALGVVVLLGGAVLMSLEILAFRVIDKTFGTALRETSVVIAVFLTAMSLGYFLGGRWGDRWPRPRTPILVLVAAGLTAFVIPWLDAAIAPRVFHSSLPLALHSTLVTTLLFAVPTVFLATLSPIAVRLLAANVGRSGSVAGSVSALSTVGSIAGSVATAFVLIDLFESVHRTIVVLALLALALAALLGVACLYGPAAASSPRVRWLAHHRVAVSLAVLAAFVLASGAGLSAWRGASVPAVESPFRLGEVVFERDSAFHHIMVVDRDRTRSLFFRYGGAQTKMSLDDPFEGAAEYTDFFHIPMVIDETVERALIIGLGGGSVPKRYVRDYPGIVVDAVEIDPVVVDVARRYFHLETGPRLRVETLDGRAYLRRSRETWDVIGLDAYTTNAYGSTMPPHLATREFFVEVASHLAPDGHFVLNVAAPPHTPIGRALSRTLHEVFPRQLVFPAVSGNTIFVASRGDTGWKRDELVARAQAAFASGRVKLPSLVASVERLLASTLPVGDAPILTDDYAPVDTLIRESRVFSAAPR